MTQETTRFGRFEVKSVLGRGAMGMVYLAEDPVIGREVAIKAIQTNASDDSKELAELKARFEREFRSAGTLSHPNVVTVYDVGEQGGVPFIAMEYVKGQSLEARLHSDHPLTVDEIADLARQLASGLDYAHDRAIVHRDVKPANIMVTWDGRPKITDFGVAKLASSTMTRTGTIIGTPAYMSPEQITGAAVSGASDQFSFAVILYQLLTGERPFSGDSPTTVLYKIVHQQPLPPHELNQQLSPAVGEVLMRALAKNPAQRFPSCSDLAEALRRALGATSPAATSVAAGSTQETHLLTRTPTVEVRPRRRAMTAGIAAGGVALVAVLLWLVFGLAGPPPPRALEVVSPLPGASIWLDGQDTGQLTPARLQLAGKNGETRRLELRRNGQVTASRDLVLGSDLPPSWQAAEQWSVNLELEVRTRRPGAELRLDGISTGRRTPTRLPLSGNAGEIRRLELYRGNQLTAREELKLAPDLPASWQPAESWVLQVSTQPAGARVLLGDRVVAAATPAAVTVSDGGEPLRLELAGYETMSLDLASLGEAQLASGLSLRLQPAVPPGTLVATASYPFTVTVNGRRSGPQTEHRISLPPGSHQVQFSAPEVFLDLRRPVQIVSQREAALTLPKLVSVNVTANPSNCKVSIDGREVDFVPLRNLPITAGAHTFKFFWPGLGKTEERPETISAERSEIFARAN